jgi:hypothetical protein
MTWRENVCNIRMSKNLDTKILEAKDLANDDLLCSKRHGLDDDR